MATSSNTTYNSVDFNFSKDDWAAVPEEAGSSNSSYPESETFQPYAEVTFNPPANASLMVIYGSTSPTDGPFALNLAPAAGVSASPNTSLTGPANQTYASNITDDTTKWASQNQVFAVRRLDTDVSSYTATVTSLAGRGLGFAFHSVEYYTLSVSLCSFWAQLSSTGYAPIPVLTQEAGLDHLPPIPLPTARPMSPR